MTNIKIRRPSWAGVRNAALFAAVCFAYHGAVLFVITQH